MPPVSLVPDDPAPPTRRHDWYREPFAWLVMGIPATAVLVGAVMLGLSMHGFDGLVVDDYYKRGKEINLSLQRDLLAAQLGLAARMRIQQGRVHVTLSAASAGFTAPSSARLSFLHATRAGYDFTLDLQNLGPQSDLGWLYESDAVALPASGKWYLQIEHDEWRLRGSITLPGQADVQFLIPDA